MTPSLQNRRGFYLDKSVNIGLVGAFIFNFCICIWFFSKLDSRVEYLEKMSANRSEDARQIASLENKIGGLQMKVDTQIGGLKEDVDELKDGMVVVGKKVDMVVDKISGRR